MAGRYEAVRPPRFEVEQDLGGERIRVRTRRNIFALLILPIWLFIWTIGGVAVFWEMLRTGEPFLVIWLCGWAAAWLFAAARLAWMVLGSELIGVTGGDLQISYRVLGWARTRLYRGRDISNLSAADIPLLQRYRYSLPFLVRPRSGAIKFSYGGRTFYAAQGLDEAEGRMIVERLLRHLPQGTMG